MATSAIQHRLLATVAFGAAIVGGALIATADLPADPYTATGTVGCADNGAPVGVWVSAPHGDAGWATIRRDDTDPGIVHFSRPIPHGGDYSLHVGCGGTPRQWAMTAISDRLRRGEIHLWCDDRPPPLGRTVRWLPPFGRPGNRGIPPGRCRPLA